MLVTCYTCGSTEGTFFQSDGSVRTFICQRCLAEITLSSDKGKGEPEARTGSSSSSDRGPALPPPEGTALPPPSGLFSFGPCLTCGREVYLRWRPTRRSWGTKFCVDCFRGARRPGVRYP